MATKSELRETIRLQELFEQHNDRYITKLQDDRAHYFDMADRLRRAFEELRNFNIPNNAREFITKTLEENPIARET